jgi:hypothetical protein
MSTKLFKTIGQQFFIVFLIALATSGCEKKQEAKLLAAPAHLTVSDTTATGATLSWISDAPAFEVQIDGKTWPVSSTSYEAIDLTPATSYTWQVRAKDGDTVSDWASSTFITKAASDDDGGDDGPVVDSGITGACSWTLTGTEGSYTLTIFGKGAMDNYSNKSDILAPWDTYRSNIKTGVIRNGVTRIGDQTFYDCSSLTKVTIGNSVEAIGDNAFRECSSLTSITIPNSVIIIDEEAFENCENLTSVTIGNAMATISGEAFKNCGLTEVVIPSSVTTIGNQAFNICRNLTNVTNLNPVPQTISNNVFKDTKISSGTLRVPLSSVDAYKVKDNWKEFGHIEGIQ